MATLADPGAADVVSDKALLADQVVAARLRLGKPAAPVALAEAITDISIMDTIQGSSTLTLHLVDPGSVLLDSGFFDADSDGRLDTIEVNYPSGTDLWWRLTQANPSWGDVPTVELVFMERTAVYLLEHFGPVKVSRAKMTRAEFLKMLCDKVKANGGIDFISHDLTVKELPAPDTPAQVSAQAKRTAKDQGLAVGDPGVTVKGQPATSAQVKLLARLLDVARKLQASPRATQAMICAAIGESTVSLSSNGNYWGVLQGAVGTFKQGDVEGMATAFLKGGKGFQGGGAIQLALNPSLTVGTIAYTVEGDLSNFQGNTAKADHFYGQWLAEANKIITAYGTGGSATSTTYRQQYNFEVGSVDAPRETYWDAANRLAAEVKWPFFVDGPRAYFDPETRLIRQGVVAVITRGDPSCISANATWDARNIATALTLSLICDPFEFRAGEVFKLVGFGPASTGSSVGLPGRWLISEIDRDVSDVVSTFQLKQPEAPAPEPASQIATRSSASGPSGSLYAACLQISSQNRAYVYGGGHGGGLAAITPSEGLDCSSSCSLALSRAGMFSGTSAIVSGQFAASWGDPGRGENFTVWANADHVFIQSEGSGAHWRFDTSGGPPSGPHVRDSWRTDLAGRTPRHWPGQ